MTFFKKMIRDEQGATAIEYGLIAALISCCRHHCNAEPRQRTQHDLQHREDRAGKQQHAIIGTLLQQLIGGRRGNSPPFLFAYVVNSVR